MPLDSRLRSVAFLLSYVYSSLQLAARADWAEVRCIVTAPPLLTETRLLFPSFKCQTGGARERDTLPSSVCSRSTTVQGTIFHLNKLALVIVSSLPPFLSRPFHPHPGFARWCVANPQPASNTLGIALLPINQLSIIASLSRNVSLTDEETRPNV